MFRQSTRTVQISNQTTQKLLRAHTRLLKFIILAEDDKHKMIATLEQNAKVIDELEAQKQTLIVLIASLKATIAELNRTDKEILTKSIKQMLKENNSSAEKVDRLRRLLETRNVELIIKNTTTGEDLAIIRDLLAMIDMIKGDLDNTRLGDDIMNAFEENSKIIKEKLNWQQDMSAEEWMKVETKRINEEFQLTEKEMEFGAFKNDTKLIDLVSDIHDIMDVTDMNYEYDTEEKTIDQLLDEVRHNDDNMMPTAAALSDNRKEQFMKMNPNGMADTMSFTTESGKLAMCLIAGLFVCCLIFMNAKKSRSNGENAQPRSGRIRENLL